MKKSAFSIFSVLIMISLLLTSIGSVQAASVPGDPVVTPISGDMEFTASVVAPDAVKGGTVVGDSGLVFPTGYASGDLQFIGNAVVVSGFDNGSASACFSSPDYAFGWLGTVAEWLNGKWNLLPSTTKPDAEGPGATVCATIYGNGTFALLGSYKAPIKESASCPKISGMDILLFPADGGFVAVAIALFRDTPFTWLQEGTPISFKIIDVSPPESLDGPLSGSGEITGTAPFEDQFAAIWFMNEPLFYTFEGEGDLSFTVRVTVKGCHYDYHFPEDYQPIDEA